MNFDKLRIMDKLEFNRILKAKASYLANLVVVVGFLITGILFIYSKTLKRDDLNATAQIIHLPLKDNDGSETSKNTKDSLELKDCSLLTQITITNNCNKTIKNIEVDLNHYYSYKTKTPNGYYFYNDSLKYFKKKSKIFILEIKPSHFEEINIYSQESGIEYDNILTTDKESFHIRPAYNVETENEFDDWFTMLVINNKIIQILIYLFTFLGIYYFIRNVIPNIVKLLPQKN